MNGYRIIGISMKTPTDPKTEAGFNELIKIKIKMSALLLIYKKTKNPLMIWMAYDYCRKKRLIKAGSSRITNIEKFINLDWIFSYFDRVATNMLDIPAGEDRASRVLQNCLEMNFGTGRSKGVFTRLEKIDRDIGIYLEYDKLNTMCKKGELHLQKGESVVSKIGEKHHLDPDHVRKIIEEMKELMETPIYSKAFEPDVSPEETSSEEQ